MRVFLEGERLIFEGVGVEFLHLKTRVARSVGGVTHEGQGRFSIAQDAAMLVVDILRDLNADVQGLPLDVSAHERAREVALGIVDNNNSTGLPAPWDSVLNQNKNQYQAVAVKAMVAPGLAGLCLFDEQGTGKTVMAIAAFDLLVKADMVTSAIIVCPKSVIPAWEKSFCDFASEYRVSVVTGPAGQKRNTLTDGAHIHIMNYEAISDLLVRLKALAGREKTLLIADESFYAKNSNAKRTRALRELRNKCCRAFVLCGTPAPNNPIDLIGQYNVADNGYTFCGFSGTGDDAQDSEVIAKAVRERGTTIRRLKDEVLTNIPAKKFEIIEAEMSGQQLRLYKKAKDELVLYLRTIDNQELKKNLASYFAKRSALMQICACPTEQDPLFSGEHAKIKALDKLLHNIVEEQGKKVVVWSAYRRSIGEIAQRYQRYGLVKIEGSTSTDERKSAIEQFQTDPNIKVFLGNPAAAGAGITLHAAADSVFVSLSDQAAQFLQALDRTHRIGQKADEVCYYVITCKETIEQNQLRILRQKEMRQHGLFHSDSDFPSSLEDAFVELGEQP